MLPAESTDALEDADENDMVALCGVLRFLVSHTKFLDIGNGADLRVRVHKLDLAWCSVLTVFQLPCFAVCCKRCRCLFTLCVGYVVALGCNFVVYWRGE